MLGSSSVLAEALWALLKPEHDKLSLAAEKHAMLSMALSFLLPGMRKSFGRPSLEMNLEDIVKCVL